MGFPSQRYFISSTKSCKPSGRHFEGFNMLRICLTHVSFCFCITVNNHLLIRFPSFLVSIKLLYNSFSIIGNITSPCRVDREVHFCLCISSSLFSHFLICFLSSIRSLIDIFPIIIVLMNSFKFELPCERSSW